MFRRKREDAPLEAADPLRAAAELLSARGPKAMLEVALAHALGLAPAASRAWAVLREPTTRIAAVRGYGPELVGLELSGPWAGGAPRLSTNVNGDVFGPNPPEVRARLAAAGMREVRAFLVVPLRGGEVNGALVLDAYGPESFSARALEAVARWGGVVTPALETARAATRYRGLARGLSRAYAEAIEARDFAALGHARRVAGYATAIAREMNLSLSEQNDAWFAGVLHDLGKLLRDDLSPPEHASLGYHTLSTVPGLEGARQAVLHHHEHFDGSGGPAGLVGGGIPLLARVVAAADAYDHLSSERGENLPATEALERARALAGTRLDPDLLGPLETVVNLGKASGERRPEDSLSG